MWRERIVVVTMLATALFLQPVGGAPAEPADVPKNGAVHGAEAETAFGWIRQLEGTWEGSYEWTGARSGGAALRMEYSSTGLGSSMVETHQPGPRASMSSLYHMDGSRLVMTHFCVQNQPRLEATSVDLEHRAIRFDFVDVTDLTPDEGHVDRVELLLGDVDGITLLYRVVHDGTHSTERIELRRVTPSEGP